MVEKIGLAQLWKGNFHCGDLFDGALFDAMAVIRREACEPLLATQ